jgi:DNA-binding response OmpR family regulator
VPAQRGEKTVPLKSPSLDQPFYRDEHLFLDLRQQLVILDGEMVTLTRREYRLLALLAQHAGDVVPRSSLLLHIWGQVPEMRPSTLDVHIRGLRRKLGVYADQYVETVVGTGYRFRPIFVPRG